MITQTKYSISLQILLPQLQEQQSGRWLLILERWTRSKCYRRLRLLQQVLVKTLELPQRLLNSSSAKYKFYSCTTQHMQPYWFFCRCSAIQTSWFCNMPLPCIHCQTLYPIGIKLPQLPSDAGSPPCENKCLFFRYFHRIWYSISRNWRLSEPSMKLEVIKGIIFQIYLKVSSQPLVM